MLTGELMPPLEAALPPQGPVPRLKPLPTEAAKGVSPLGPVIGAVVAVLFVLALAAGALLWRRRRRQRKHMEQAPAGKQVQVRFLPGPTGPLTLAVLAPSHAVYRWTRPR